MPSPGHSVLHSGLRERAQQVGSVGAGRGEPQPRPAEAAERAVHPATAVQDTPGEETV